MMLSIYFVNVRARKLHSNHRRDKVDKILVLNAT